MSRRWLLPLGWSRERCSCRLAFLTRPDGVPADLGRRLGSGVDRELRPGSAGNCANLQVLVGDFLPQYSLSQGAERWPWRAEADRCRAVDREEVPVGTDGHV